MRRAGALRLLARLVAALVLLIAGVLPALAHPHIFIDAKARIVFNDAGDVVAVRHQWTFDEAFSAWAIQGLDTNNDGVTSEKELQPLANENMKGLAAYSYYTFIGEGDAPNLTFKHMPNPRLDYSKGRITLNFGVQLDKPYHIKKDLEISIDDPEYYVAITFAGPQAISLENAPAGCSATLNPPKTIPPKLADRLYALGADVVALPPDLAAAMRGMQGSIDVRCNYAEAGPIQNPRPADDALTAIDAANAVALTKPIPFGGPPREVGLGGIPTTGILGWVMAQQKEFYQLLTNAMARLRTDNTAFLVLGSLSFFYGIFHAAGPGHGKVVISSYVLANERQYRQGMLLSFASAMLASAVAVGFILVAATVLKLTGDAMGNVAGWIGIGSYAMVACLGIWLMVRHIFGLGHHHHEPVAPAPKVRADHALARRHLFGDELDDHDHDHDHDHEHDHEFDHAHGHAHEHGHQPLRVNAAAPLRGAPNLLARAFETSARAAGTVPARAAADAGFVRAPLHPHGRGGQGPGRLHDHHGAEGHSHATHGHAGHDHGAHDHGDHDHAGHTHVVTPELLGNGSWRESASVVLAIGLRPCSGALVVMVFALSQGVLWAGIISVFLMGLGTAITVATLATLAMTAKGLARRLSRGRGGWVMKLVWWAELGGAFLVFVLGCLLIAANLWG